MKTTSAKALALIVITLSLHAISAPAAVIGYWRFESTPGFLVDSGVYGLDLTQGGNGTVTNPALAGTGPTSKFFNPIPQTEAANGNVATFGAASDSYLSRSDSAEFAVTSFTFEAMFNRGNTFNQRYIGSQSISTGNQRSWGLSVWASNAGVVADRNKLFLNLSQDGATAVNITSNFTISTGVDYYTAFSFNATDGNATFYLQDLTNSGTLQSEVVATGLTGVKDSTGAFNIGALAGAANSIWIGSIDEARLSNTVLAASELLATAAVPEPGPVALLVLGGMWVMIFRRSRRQPLS
jgi:hypothetical protein